MSGYSAASSGRLGKHQFLASLPPLSRGWPRAWSPSGPSAIRERGVQRCRATGSAPQSTRPSPTPPRSPPASAKAAAST